MSLQKISETIAQTVILPNASETEIRAKAEQMGYGTALNRVEAAKLYNAVIEEIVDKINVFILDEKKIDHSREIELIRPDAFRTDIQTVVQRTIKELYDVEVVPSFAELSQERGCVIL